MAVRWIDALIVVLSRAAGTEGDETGEKERHGESGNEKARAEREKAGRGT